MKETLKSIGNAVLEAFWLKDPQATIESIHKEFNTAHKTRLESADEILAQSSTDKAKRLAAQGFGSNVEVIEHEELERNKKEALKNANYILHYNQKYPVNKFLVEKDVERICKKYNLVLGKIEQYKGFVPDKNLKEIESFRIHDEDRVGFSHTGRFTGKNEDGRRMVSGNTLHIVAPLKDMDLKSWELEGYKLVKKSPPDPVVLFEVKGGYLILTAWGDEASDPIIQNPKHS